MHVSVLLGKCVADVCLFVGCVTVWKGVSGDAVCAGFMAVLSGAGFKY